VNVALLVNPRSGRGKAAIVGREIHVALEQAGHRVDAANVARELTIPPDSHALVVVGGDGTVHHCAVHASTLGIPLYQIPMGTENLFARHFGMTRDPARLVDALKAMRVVTIDVGIVTKSPHPGKADLPPEPPPHPAFLLMLSVGPDAGVVHRLAAARIGRIGHWSYVAPIMRELLSPSLEPLEIEVDGKAVVQGRRGLLVIGNCPEYGVSINPAIRACNTDGLLDLVFFPASTAAELVAWTLRSRLGRHVRSSRLVYETGREIRVRTLGHAMPYQIDGEAGSLIEPGVDMFVTASRAVLKVLTI